MKSKDFKRVDFKVGTLTRFEELIVQKRETSMKKDLESQGVVIVMLRLPYILKKTTEGYRVELEKYSSQIQGLLKLPCRVKWVGLPTNYIPQEERQRVKEAYAKVNCSPVFLEEDTYELGISLFAKTRLWQLFHYYTMQIDESGQQYAEKLQQEWLAYRAVNMEFAKAALEFHEEGWLVWVHDYHMMLVPGFLRIHLPQAVIAYFQHTPFPSSEFYRMFPFREEILSQVLKANLIGFNGYDYSRHFTKSCTNVLGLVANSQGVDALPKGGCFVTVGAYPISINTDLFRETLGDPEVKGIQQELLQAYEGKKIILGIDKLDFPKGIIHKLAAFEKFLKENSVWREKAVLIQILGNVYTRTNVKERKKLLSQVNERAAKINGVYGNFSSMPVHHFSQKLEFKRLVALLSIADVCLVTSLRDGMSLVAYEFVACQQENIGVLVLSEFTGAAQSLGMGAVLVNPWNTSKTAESIKSALEMSYEEKQAKHQSMYNYMLRYNCDNWANTFLRDLQSSDDQGVFYGKIPSVLPFTECLKSFQLANKRLVVLSVLGVLGETPKGKLNPYMFQKMVNISYQTKAFLRQLASDSKNTVVVLSQLEKSSMDRLFQGLPIWVTAENGAYFKHAAQSNWESSQETLDTLWKEGVIKVFKEFTERTPGSFIVGENSACLSWNFGLAGGNYDFQSSQASSLMNYLWTGPLVNGTAEVIVGENSIEVRPVKVDAANAFKQLMKHWKDTKFDYTLVLGKFHKKDEEIYNLLKEEFTDNSWMCTVNRNISLADYYVTDPKEFLSHLTI